MINAATLPPDTIIRYYKQGVWVLIPLDRYKKFLEYLYKNGIEQHEGKSVKGGVMVRYIK